MHYFLLSKDPKNAFSKRLLLFCVGVVSNTETGKTRNEKMKTVLFILLRSFFSTLIRSLCVLGSNNRNVFFHFLDCAVSKSLYKQAQHHRRLKSPIIMAFITKAFYEQAFERNLKAQTTTTTTTRQHADIVPTMTHTQRATLTTAMFTAHSKKEVVRHLYRELFLCEANIYICALMNFLCRNMGGEGEIGRMVSSTRARNGRGSSFYATRERFGRARDVARGGLRAMIRATFRTDFWGRQRCDDVFDDGLVFNMRVKKPSCVLSLGIGGATVDARDALEGGLLVDL